MQAADQGIGVMSTKLTKLKILPERFAVSRLPPDSELPEAVVLRQVNSGF
jgi:hypothetical protein